MALNGNGDAAGAGDARMVKLKSSDGEVFTIDYRAAMCSTTIKTMFDDLGMDDGEEVPIPLPNVDAITLKKVIEWVEHHKDDPVPTEDDEKKEDDLFSTWDAQYLRVDENTIFELTLAANYLHINGLLNLTCKVIANMLRGKTPEWCREHFGIVNDFTPEELEQIRKENEWCDDK